jgi:hypothetical protein
MNCENIKELLLSYINNESDAKQREDINNHLLVCPTCKGETEALAATESKLRQAYGAVAAGVSPSPGVLNAIRQEVARRERSRSTVKGWVGLQLRQTFGAFNWRSPFRQTAFAGTVAMVCLAVILFNRGPLHTNDSLSGTWTANEQAAIDIAKSDPGVRAMLDGEGIAYEVIPIDTNGATKQYQVGIASVDEGYSDDLRLRGKDSNFVPQTYSEGATDSLFDAITFNGMSNTIVDISANSVLQYHSISLENEGGSEWLSAEQIEEAAQIAGSFDSFSVDGVVSWGALLSSDSEVLVKNVSQLNAYDADANAFSDEMVVWVRLSISDQTYFAQVDMDERKVVKLIKGGE